MCQHPQVCPVVHRFQPHVHVDHGGTDHHSANSGAIRISDQFSTHDVTFRNANECGSDSNAVRLPDNGRADLNPNRESHRDPNGNTDRQPNREPDSDSYHQSDRQPNLQPNREPNGNSNRYADSKPDRQSECTADHFESDGNPND